METKPVLDLLRRVFVPREFRIAEGGSVFRTIDGQTYRRLADGSIRRATPKVSGKAAKRARRAARRSAGERP